MSNPVTFLINSINDIQNVIRAIDTKLGFLLVILVFPIVNFGKIFNTILNIFVPLNLPCKILFFIIVFIFALSWILAFLCTLKSLTAIDNPAKHIKNDNESNGLFYSPNLFDFTLLDFLINRKKVLARESTSVHLDNIPGDEQDIMKELTFEQMKLAYIRDIKIKRQRVSYFSAVIWLFSGLVIWLLKLIN